MKKQKKVFNKGQKLGEIQVNSTCHLKILATLLVVFNLFLIVAAIAVAVLINHWIIYTLDVLIVAFCLLRSFSTYFVGGKQFCYALYENCIFLDSIWYDSTIIEYSIIKRIKFRVGFLDKLFGKNTCTLTLFLNDALQSKVNLYFVKEDPQALIEKIKSFSNLSFAPTKK